jgi:site-specific DNA-methyltransferase (adenine-specific)
MTIDLRLGDCLEVLKTIPDNSIDSVVTDPPYGLGKEPIAEQLMKDWIEKGYHEVKGGGFMGKEWDAFVPQPIFWKEVFRVLKHGGHVVSFFGTRTYDWGVMAMRFAGFEIRDCIQWLYGSGFPKSYNIAKGIEGKIVNGSASWNDWKKLDGEKEQVNWGYSKQQAEQGYRDDYSESNKERVGKVNFQSEEAKYWDGWGSALKPANEPIVLARKPLEKGLSIADNVLKWGTGGINIDGCRVSGVNMTKGGCKFNSAFFESGNSSFTKDFDESKGRFPANVILTHHPDCECVGTKKVKGQIDKPTNRTQKGNTWDDNNSGLRKSMPKNSGGFGDVDGNETIENWNCHEDCPIKILDEQSGVLKSGDMDGEYQGFGKNGIYGGKTKGVSYGDKGGASRFFYVAKASQSERNKGLDDFEKQPLAFSNQAKAELARGNTEFADDTKMHNKVQFRANNHPTVKPIKLMQYLARLITPPNGVVLDPFMGSGTTGIACKLEGFDFVGMEQDENYHKIAISRIENYLEQDEKIVIKVTTETEITEPKKTIIQSQLF